MLGSVAYVAAPALTTNVVIIAVVLFAGGVALMLWNITTVSFRQRVTPDHLLGRVNSTYRLVAWGTRPLGAALGGALGQWLGLRSVFAVMAFVTAAVLIPNRRITERALAEAKAIEERAPPPAPPRHRAARHRALRRRHHHRRLLVRRNVRRERDPSRRSLPSSISIMIPTLVIAFDIDAIRKIVSVFIGASASMSRLPYAASCATLPWRTTMVTMPASRCASM